MSSPQRKPPSAADTEALKARILADLQRRLAPVESEAAMLARTAETFRKRLARKGSRLG